MLWNRSLLLPKMSQALGYRCKVAYKQFRSSDDWETWVGPLNELILLGDKRYGYYLLTAFEHQTYEKQIAIAFAMRELAGPSAKRKVIKLLKSNQLTTDVRTALTEVIGCHSLSECRPLLLAQLLDPSPRVRFWTCEALGFIGTMEDIVALKAMRSDLAIGHDGQTVAQAAQAAIIMIMEKHSIEN